MREKLQSFTLSQLKEIAKSAGLKGITGLKKEELIERLVELDEKMQSEKAAKASEEKKAEEKSSEKKAPAKKSGEKKPEGKKSDHKKGEEKKAEALIKTLYGYYCEHPDAMPQLYRSVVENEGAERAACDYVSSMSDVYVLKIYNELFIPSSWMV